MLRTGWTEAELAASDPHTVARLRWLLDAERPTPPSEQERGSGHEFSIHRASVSIPGDGRRRGRHLPKAAMKASP